MSLRRKRPRRHVTATRRTERAIATRSNEQWSMDFVSDALFDGRRIRALTLVDNHTREALAIVVDVRLSYRGADVVGTLERVAARYGLPRQIRPDNVLCREAAERVRPQVSAAKFELTSRRTATQN